MIFFVLCTLEELLLKKPMAILLLICLFLEVIGFYFVFLLRREAVKQEVWSYLHQNQHNNYAQTLSFSLNDPGIRETPVWENENEFSFKGEMYDVIEKKELNGNLVISCISDKKETSLIKDFEKDLSGNTSNKNSNGNADQLIKLLTMPYLAFPNQTNLHYQVCLQVYPGHYSLHFSQHNQDILTPPPQIG